MKIMDIGELMTVHMLEGVFKEYEAIKHVS